MNLVLIKLASGEDIVADCQEEKLDTLTVIDPQMFMYGSDQSGAMGIKLVDYMYYADEKVFTIDKKHVICYTYKINSKLVDYYKSTVEAKNKSFADILKNILEKLDPETIH